jgi:hypothetical protein
MTLPNDHETAPHNHQCRNISKNASHDDCEDCRQEERWNGIEQDLALQDRYLREREQKERERIQRWREQEERWKGIEQDLAILKGRYPPTDDPTSPDSSITSGEANVEANEDHTEGPGHGFASPEEEIAHYAALLQGFVLKLRAHPRGDQAQGFLEELRREGGRFFKFAERYTAADTGSGAEAEVILGNSDSESPILRPISPRLPGGFD